MSQRPTGQPAPGVDTRHDLCGAERITVAAAAAVAAVAATPITSPRELIVHFIYSRAPFNMPPTLDHDAKDGGKWVEWRIAFNTRLLLLLPFSHDEYEIGETTPSISSRSPN